MSRRDAQRADKGAPVAGALALVPMRPAELVPVNNRTLAVLAPRFLVWLATVRGRAENTVLAYGQNLQSFLRACAQAHITEADQVTWREVEAYLGWLREVRGLKATTANQHLHALRTFWVFLIREGIATTNPAAVAFSQKTPKRLPKMLPLPIQERVLEELARDTSPKGVRDLAIVAAALLTGLRCEEIVTLKVADVSLDGRAEHALLRVIGKGDKERELPIVPRLRDILVCYLSEARPRLIFGGPAVPWLFVNGHPSGAWRTRRAGRPLLTRTIFNMMRRQVSPIAGRPVNPHLLRHSFASRLRAGGAPLELIQEALGHASISTTTMYAHLATPARNAQIAKYLEAGE